MRKPRFSFLFVTADHLQLLMSRHLMLIMFRSAVRRPQTICCGFGVLSSRCFTRGLTCDSIVGAGPLPRARCSASVWRLWQHLHKIVIFSTALASSPAHRLRRFLWCTS